MLTIEEQIELCLIDERLRVEEAREDFLAFVKYMMPEFEVNWHHAVIANRLSQLPKQKRQRICIAVPAQTGKSELVSRKLPAWLLGQNPDYRILLVSYGTEFAINFNRANQKAIDSEEYRCLFPGTSLNRKNVRTISGAPKRTSDYFEVVNRKGFLRTVGLGAGSSGYPADVLIIDDPYPDVRSALSKTYRQMVWDWFTSVGLQRLHKDAHVIILHTRWYKEDLTGTLIDMAQKDPNADQYEYLRFPSIADDDLHPEDPRAPGEPLWPEWKGDTEALLRKRALIGEFLFAAMEQNNPVAIGGNLFKSEHFRFYDHRTRPADFDMVFTSWDANLSPNEENDSDYACGFVIGLSGPNLFILARFYGRWEFDTLIASMKRARDIWNPSATVVENKASGAPALQTLRKEIRGLIANEPKGSKVSRALACIPTAAAGNIWFPDTPWAKEAITELCEFPRGSHDDQVDALTQAILWLQENEGKRRYQSGLAAMR